MADNPFPNPGGGGGASADGGYAEEQGWSRGGGDGYSSDNEDESREREEDTADEDELVGDYGEEQRDYYAILNVPRDASDTQLRQSYRHLSLHFHPDKQPPELRQQATSRFNLIQQAYETLIDPRKRIIYNNLGEAGLRVKSLEVGTKAMSPDEFRYYIEEKVRRTHRETLEREVGFHGVLVVGLDGTRWFGLEQEYIEGPDGQLIPVPQQDGVLTRVFVQHGFHVPMLLLRDVINHPVSINRVIESVKSFIPGVETREKSDEELDEELARDKAIQQLPPPTLRLSASLGGRTVNAVAEDATGKQKRIAHAPLIAQTAMELGLVHAFPAMAPQPPRKQGDKGSGWMEKEISIARVMADSQVALTHQIIAKSSTLAYTRPILGRTTMLQLTAQIHHRSRKAAMPMVEAMLTRQVTKKGTFFIAFGTGTRWGFYMPFGLGRWGSAGEWWRNASSRIGFTYHGGGSASAHIDDEDDGDVEEEEASEEGNNSERANGNANGRNQNSGRKAPPKPRANPNTVATFYLAANNITPTASILTIGLDLSRTFLSRPRPKHLPRMVPLPNSYRGIRAQLKSSLNLMGTVSTSVSFTRPVASYSRLGFSVSIEPTDPGVVFGIVFRRLGQKIQIPILATKFIDSEDLVHRGFNVWGVGVVSIAFGWWVWESGIVRIWERRQRKLGMAKKRRALREKVEKGKREAQEAIALMEDGVRKKMMRENENGGLVVLEATYGLPEMNEKGVMGFLWRKKDSEGARRIDVKIPVAAWVEDTQLVIPANISKSSLVGFYDPFPGRSKTLKIRYLFRGVLHEVEVPSGKGVVCPNRGHIVREEK
ncbi:hypothetical protein L211DRAFT_834702 [Terfezia boudieri ATCC MYA-4762]|uniref:J domain-containing protein n=1 Tax=Terfezia boudieri ATCC MYA-4762 TaxID=1051890 RepID=A0A3N4MC83_9PEZI|nr:hypothetical protein L211DRAFT_834702 [Terfezia boudieri ATCC MYA-4762]